MTNDQALDTAVRALLREPAATRAGGLYRALDRVGTTPQRRRRWWPIALNDTGPRVGGFTMFSALRFIAGGVIVALFGGFLLAGVLTTQQDGEVPPAAVSASPTSRSGPDEVTEPPDPQPSPTTTEGLLSGMITEEVEPGVLRVLNDGVRDLPCEGWPCAVVAGQDGSIWLVRDGDDYAVDRLGSPESDSPPEGWDVVAPDGTFWRSDTRMVAPDGTDWVSDEKPWKAPEGVREITRLYAREDGSWTLRAEGPELDGWIIAADGTVWASYRTEDRSVVARLGADGWEPLEDPAPARGGLSVTQSGELWVAGGWLGGYMERRDDGSWREYEGGSLWRYREDDSAWHEVTVDALVHHPGEQRVAVGPDGTVWFAGAEPVMVDGKPVPDPFRDLAMSKPGDPFLMRFDGTEWQRWGPADGVPPLGGEATPPELIPTPDGGLWLMESNCADRWGVAHLDEDGSAWRHFLAGHCIGSMDIAADGALWLMAPTNDEDDTYELYVITPEAAAAKAAEPPPAEEASTTTADLLSGMTTEEVEPGVYRVVNDGVRDLTSKPNEDIVAGHDGGIWLLREHRFLRLGTPGGHKWVGKKAKVQDFEVAPNGTAWTVQKMTAKGRTAISSYDGRQWTTVFRPADDGNVEVAPDGTVLAGFSSGDGQDRSVIRLYPDIEGFELLPPAGAGAFLTTGGEVWAADGRAVHGDRSLWRYGELDAAWHHVTTLPPPAYSLLLDDFAYGTPVDVVGSEGTIWYAYAEPLMADGELVLDEKGRATLGDSFLMRFDDSGWQRWGTAEGVPSQSAFILTPAPDGDLWLRRNARREPGVDGIFRFDGSTWRHYLPDHDIDSVDVAPDGSVWLLSSADDLYVITPEAVAASE